MLQLIKVQCLYLIAASLACILFCLAVKFTTVL